MRTQLLLDRSIHSATEGTAAIGVMGQKKDVSKRLTPLKYSPRPRAPATLVNTRMLQQPLSVSSHSRAGSLASHPVWAGLWTFASSSRD